MELNDFFCQLRSEIQTDIVGDIDVKGKEFPFPEIKFAERVIEHMISAGMTFDTATICYHNSKSGNANVKITGYALSDDSDQLDLFVTVYSGTNIIEGISDSETKTAASQCLRFLSKSVEGKIIKEIDRSNDAYKLAQTLQYAYNKLEQIRVYVLTDKIARSKNFNQREVHGKSVRLEVMDIERLYRHLVVGKPRDEIIIDCEKVCGMHLPCIYITQIESSYDFALTVLPGESLRFLYEKYGARLLEANVRSFLSVKGNVNKGIRDTIRNEPSMFMAYNNGIVIITDEVGIDEHSSRGTSIAWMKGIQIVNGGQTTASIYFAEKKFPEIDLRKLRVPAKIIILRDKNKESEENLINKISFCANSQNSIKQSDLSSNRQFHCEFERIVLDLYCPDGLSKWFYERASGSYNVFLAHEGSTPAKLKHLKEIIPVSRKITKTDLAKYINAWDKKPVQVAMGSQKNYAYFMHMIDDMEENNNFKPDITWVKHAIAKAILFKQTDKIVASLHTASKIHITTYTVSLLSERFGDSIDFDKIWQNQDLSQQFKILILDFARKVDVMMTRGSQNKLMSEWAKKDECWRSVINIQTTIDINNIPEIKKYKHYNL
ncbi:MAG: AIPR family protein [Lachnospiraceae bacterium]|nr:AIPR family protein [Lachnospiraceae bacterium]